MSLNTRHPAQVNLKGPQLYLPVDKDWYLPVDWYETFPYPLFILIDNSTNTIKQTGKCRI